MTRSASPTAALFPQLERPEQAPLRLTVTVAITVWLLAWLAGNLLGAVPVQVFDGGGAQLGITAGMVGATVVTWAALVVGAWMASNQFGTSRPLDDYALRARPADLLGIPLGVATQLVLVPGLYWPLRELWPDTFSSSKLEDNVRDLVDHTRGGGWLVVGLVVLIGAPLVEELVYRGMIHGALVRRLNHPVAVLLSSALFAVIHFRPVEFPGLFVIGAVLAVCFSVTRRLGLGIVTHLAFNATALVLIAR